MRSYTTTLLFGFISLVLSCNEQTSSAPAAENALDAGREFVRAALDGDHVKAARYLLKDSLNQRLFDQQVQNYNNLNEAERKRFLESSIRPVSIKTMNDSTTLFRYYHSANPTDTTELRITKKQGQWLVDLKSVIKL